MKIRLETIESILAGKGMVGRKACWPGKGAAGKRLLAAALGVITVFLAAFPMEAAAASPEFAHSAEKWASLRDNKLEFDEIADLIHEYNTTVQQNLLDYNEYKGKTSSEIAEEYYNSANELMERINYPEDDAANYGSQMSSALNSELQAENLMEQGDKNVDDGEIVRLGYEKAEAELVKKAQSLMISYWRQLESLESLKESVTQAESAYQSAETRKAAGMAVQADLESAGKQVTNAKASLREAEISLEETEKSLYILLGWQYSDQVEIGGVPEPDLEKIRAISVDADISSALESNYNLRISARRIENAQSETVRESEEKTYASQKETVTSSVKSAYDNLMLSLSSYEQAAESLALEEKNLAAAELRLTAGTMTKNNYEKQQSSYQTAEVNEKTKKLALLSDYLEYSWAVRGLAQAA